MQYAVVMAGGGGTRLWPAARQDRPKQLQNLIFEQPLITETVQRLQHHFAPERILVVTAARYTDAIRQVLPQLPPQNVLSEPFGRNTAAAIALAAFQIGAQDMDAVFSVFPADHIILYPQVLYTALDYGEDLARRHRVVDIGVPPSHPETGYGYIELGEAIGQRGDLTAYAVQRFVEKPDVETARRYLQAGNYIWNSGMFVWRAGSFLDALRAYLPETFHALLQPVVGGNEDALRAAYETIPDISVDYGIMERVNDVVAIPADFGWRDVGDWAALYDLMEKDNQGNAFSGTHITVDTDGCLFVAPHKTVAAVGLHDMVVVDTPDALLILPRHRAQEVKKVLERIKEEGETRLL